MLNLFDIKTLLLTNVLVNLVIAGLLIYYWKRQQTYPGFGFWAASHAIGGGTYLLYALRGQIPDIISIVCSGALVALFSALRLEGIRLFVDGSWRRAPLFFYPLLIVPPLFYFGQITDDILMRTIFINSLMTVVIFQILAILVRRARQPGNAVYWAPIFFFGVFVSLLVTRVVIWLLIPDVRGFFASSSANNSFFLALLLHDIGIAISYLMLNAKRQTDELQRAHDELQQFNDSLQQQVQRETEKRLLQERLLAQNARLAAMGKMTAVIAHQWRQPLTTLGMILQRLELLRERGQLTDQAFVEARKSGMRQIESMSETIDDFRNFYSPDRIRSAFSVCQKLKEAIALVESSFAASGVTLEHGCEIAANDILHGYPNQFVQAIVNLLHNARDATVSGTAPPTAGKWVRIAATPGDGALVITVADNGCGIPEEIADRLFEPFVTSKESGGGSGLGLYLTKTIIEDGFGGRIDVRSCSGETCFTLTLPVNLGGTTDGAA